MALAGIMGGLNSEIKEGTKNVFFEAAKFARDNVRKTSRALGQSSDSSFRFEKGVDAYTTGRGMARALHLIEEICCGVVTDLCEDVCAADLTPRKMTASVAKITRSRHRRSETRNPFRFDEALLQTRNFGGRPERGSPRLAGRRGRVCRFGGRASIRMLRLRAPDAHLPRRASVTGGGLSAEQKQELRVKDVLRTQGFLEACNYSFYSPKEFDLFRLPEDAEERNAVRVLNPISEELSAMRTFLAPSMLQNAVRNIRRGNDEGGNSNSQTCICPKPSPPSGSPRREKPSRWGSGAANTTSSI